MSGHRTARSPSCVVDNLYKQYETDAGPQPVLKDVSLSIESRRIRCRDGSRPARANPPS